MDGWMYVCDAEMESIDPQKKPSYPIAMGIVLAVCERVELECLLRSIGHH